MTDWQSTKYGTVELPGRCIHLATSQLANSVWALVEVERKWWQIWYPKKRQKWINVVIPDAKEPA